MKEGEPHERGPEQEQIKQAWKGFCAEASNTVKYYTKNAIQTLRLRFKEIRREEPHDRGPEKVNDKDLTEGSTPNSAAGKNTKPTNCVFRLPLTVQITIMAKQHRGHAYILTVPDM